MKFLIVSLMKTTLIYMIFIFFFCVLSFTQTHVQQPEEANSSNLLYVKEVRANNITFLGGLGHRFTTGIYVEVVDQETMKVDAQAQITQVTTEEVTAIISDFRLSRVDVGDLIRLPAKVVRSNPNWVEIDQGLRQGLTEGTTFKIFRMGVATEITEIGLDGKEGLSPKIAVSRAVLIDVRQEDATARIIGKRTIQSIEGDFVQIETYTTIHQKSGNMVYLDVASDAMSRLSEGMVVYVFQKNFVSHPDESRRFVEWYETVCNLTIQHLAKGSYMARCTINDDIEYVPSSNDYVSIKDLHVLQRDVAARNTYVLKSGADKIYLSRFPEAEEDLVFIATRKKNGSNQIDPNFLNADLQDCSLQIESVRDQIIAATFLVQSKNPYQVGDCIRIFR